MTPFYGLLNRLITEEDEEECYEPRPEWAKASEHFVCVGICVCVCVGICVCVCVCVVCVCVVCAYTCTCTYMYSLEGSISCSLILGALLLLLYTC